MFSDKKAFNLSLSGFKLAEVRRAKEIKAALIKSGMSAVAADKLVKYYAMSVRRTALFINDNAPR
jgi:hypothetical protein